MKYRHFSTNELKGLESSTVRLLDWAREFYGKPIILTSTRRTVAQNKKAGGARDSSHLTGWAVDIRWPSSLEDLGRLIWALSQAGFSRIGIKVANHVHVDNDPSKVRAFWVET